MSLEPSRRTALASSSSLLSSFSLFLSMLVAPATPAVAQTGVCSVFHARYACIDGNSPGFPLAPGFTQDQLGRALAFGDFDGDGKDDLAIGAPGEFGGEGRVFVLRSRGLTLQVAGAIVLDQDDLPGADGGREDDDLFGQSLAAGDFDGDGYDDLAIGSPGEDINGPDTCSFNVCNDAGIVHVVFGGATGLVPGSAIVFVLPHPDDGDQFGYALAAGEATGDEFDDLAIGEPGFYVLDFGNVIVKRGGAGAAALAFEWVPFSPDTDEQIGFAVAIGHLSSDATRGMVAAGAPLDDPGGTNDAGIGRVAEINASGIPRKYFIEQEFFGTNAGALNDEFGSALAIGDFNHDGIGDLAIGAPNKDHGDGTPNRSGRVYVAYGPLEAGEQSAVKVFGEDIFAGQTPAAYEHFGAALAAGDVDGDGDDDLVIGVPGESSDDRGFVYEMDGSASGLVAPASGFNFSEPALGGLFQQDAHFGQVLATGDINGDGVDEIAIGIPERDVSGTDNGRVYVTRILNAKWIFGEGFDGGATDLWSATAD